MPTTEVVVPDKVDSEIAQLVERGEFLNREQAIEELLSMGISAYDTGQSMTEDSGEEMIQALNDVREGDVLAYFGDLDSHTLTLVSVGYDDDEPTLNTGETIALLTDVFDFDSALLAFADRRVRDTSVTAWMSLSTTGSVI